ncbi:MAG TPA: dihydroorotase [Gammaproteobacteria bacterium]|nr:dihydroorotase [Gammaproteobacteria bacterium]
MDQITLTYPDDWHIHLRDGEYLSQTVKDASTHFKRAIVMPNLDSPITTVAAARSYQTRILAATPKNRAFKPLMTLYLTNETTPTLIAEAKQSGIVHACKLYPQGVTTHSEAGVTKIEKIYPVLEAMSEYRIPLLIHGELSDPNIDIFDREKFFIDSILSPLVTRFSGLKIIFEHITTQEAVTFVKEASSRLAATITPHHLWYNRNALFSGGLHPHYYCLPLMKRRKDQEALIEAATGHHPQFFIGTDSAPHPKSRKESACGCAGIYNAHAPIELYCEIFEAHDALDNLENFVSFNGPRFYEMPPNKETIVLKKHTWTLPETIKYGKDLLVPFRAGQSLRWKRID